MNESAKDLLFSPCELGGLKLRNRVVLAPLTRSRAGEERMPNELMAKYYVQRASAGLLITEATVISEQGFGWLNTPGIYTDAQASGWKIITNNVHDAGAPIFLQLWHCGRASHTDFFPPGLGPVAPSSIAITSEDIHTASGKKPHSVPRALETEEIPKIVADYRAAAERAKQAGFDGIELHGANGYLIDQFLQSKTNKRTDRYGGSIENRFRFLREVVEAVLQVFPANRVGVRLAPNGVYNDMGSPDFRETFLYVAEELNEFKLAYLHVLSGLGFGFHKLGEPMLLKEFREKFKGLLIGNVGFTQETAEEAIEKGEADLIAFGRPFISNPDLVERFKHGWELNPPAPMSDWYSFTEHGYTDFPMHSSEKVLS